MHSACMRTCFSVYFFFETKTMAMMMMLLLFLLLLLVLSMFRIEYFDRPIYFQYKNRCFDFLFLRFWLDSDASKKSISIFKGSDKAHNETEKQRRNEKEAATRGSENVVIFFERHFVWLIDTFIENSCVIPGYIVGQRMREMLSYLSFNNRSYFRRCSSFMVVLVREMISKNDDAPYVWLTI